MGSVVETMLFHVIVKDWMFERIVDERIVQPPEVTFTTDFLQLERLRYDRSVKYIFERTLTVVFLIVFLTDFSFKCFFISCL